MEFQTTLLEVIKERYIETCGDREFGGVVSKAQGPYYLKRLEDNLIETMSEKHIDEYRCGSGNELDSKMKALRSSSALTFNLLGNGSFTFESARLTLILQTI